MKLVYAGRFIFGAICAILLGVTALWLWSRSAELASMLASSAIVPALSSQRGTQAVCAAAVAAAAGAQAILMRDVVPAFYVQRKGDDVVATLFIGVAAAALLGGLVLLVSGS